MSFTVLRNASLAIVALALLGCGTMMFTIDDRAGSNESVALSKGSSVSVPLPTISPDLVPSIEKARRTEQGFASQVQSEMIRALGKRGVTGVAGEKPGMPTLTIHITRYVYGSGAARFFLSGTGIGNSKLDGEAILSTPQGRRELLIRKTAGQAGTTEAGDQTNENITYFAGALAGEVVR